MADFPERSRSKSIRSSRVSQRKSQCEFQERRTSYGNSIFASDCPSKCMRFSSGGRLWIQSKESETLPDIRASYYYRRRNHAQTPNLIHWFRDTRPILEHVSFIRIDGINGTVAHNFKPTYQTELNFQSMARRSIYVARASTAFARKSCVFDDENFLETLRETKQRANFLNKVVDHYQAEEVHRNQKEKQKKKAAPSLEKQIEKLDSMSTIDIFDEEAKKGEMTSKKSKVRFRLRSNSIYESVMGSSEAKIISQEDRGKPTPTKGILPSLKRRVMPLKSSRPSNQRQLSVVTNPKRKWPYLSFRSRSQDDNWQQKSKGGNKKEVSFHSTQNTSGNHYDNTQEHNNARDRNQNADVDDLTAFSDFELLSEKDRNELKRRLQAETDLINIEITFLQDDNNELKKKMMILKAPLTQSLETDVNADVPVPRQRSQYKTMPSLFQIFVYLLAYVIGSVIGKLLL